MRPHLLLSKSSLDIAASKPLPRQLSDDDLLSRLKRDDARALELVLARYWTLVVDYVDRLTRSRDAAEDVAQRTFCQLWDRRAQWGEAGSLRALLCRIARNYAVSEHRRELADERSAFTFLELHATPATAHDGADSAQLRALIDSEIARLPDRRREILVLRCYHDLSYKEIAEVMNIAEQTVANQLSKGMASLRAALAGELDSTQF
ncbi:MAG TPA: sigma-70 family RNA polymerase sigma factor [Gemmatimonadaceae bacterium]|nr:sigma-70 family RNA polymerase sigma factor [Gemmatimonadaceae bacterium]